MKFGGFDDQVVNEDIEILLYLENVNVEVFAASRRWCPVEGCFETVH